MVFSSSDQLKSNRVRGPPRRQRIRTPNREFDFNAWLVERLLYRSNRGNITR
jgi:hypothetical protein